MKRFYFIFLPVVLVFLYSIPGVFCLSGGGGIASSSLKKTTTTVIRNFQPVVLVFLYSTPQVFCLSGGGIASSSFFILNILYIFCTCTRYSYIVYPEYFVCRGGGG